MCKKVHLFCLFSLVMACEPYDVTRQSFRSRNTTESSNATPNTQIDPVTGLPTTNAPGTTVPMVDESTLAPYLFKRAEAQAIIALVEPYRAPQSSPDTKTASSAMANARQFMQSVATRAMALPKLQPGRSFKVSTLDDEFPNAYADGFQNIFVNTGTLKLSIPEDSFSTFCHEMAHSTKNHVVTFEAKMAESNVSARMQAVDQEVQAYMSRQYDSRSGTYTHNLTEYQRVRRLSDEVNAVAGLIIKRQESEADVIGAMICASLGMKASENIKGYRSFAELVARLASQQSGPSAAQLNNGERFNIPSDKMQDYVYSFLFPTDSHPTDAERVLQLERLADIIDARFDSQQTLAKEWLTQIRSLAGVGLTLTDSDREEALRQQTLTATTSEGRNIVIIKPKNCHPGLHR